MVCANTKAEGVAGANNWKDKLEGECTVRCLRARLETVGNGGKMQPLGMQQQHTDSPLCAWCTFTASNRPIFTATWNALEGPNALASARKRNGGVGSSYVQLLLAAVVCTA